MDNTIDLIKMIDEGEAHVRRILIKRKDPSLMPFYLFKTPNGDDAIMPCDFQSDDMKDVSIAVAHFAARSIGALAAMFVAESWMLILKNNEGKNIDLDNAPRPSKSPDRIECVLLVATDGVNTRQRTLRVARHKTTNKIIALHRDEDLTATEAMCRMTDGLIPVEKNKVN